MRKLITTALLTSLALGFLETNYVLAKPVTVESYVTEDGSNMYGFPTKQYINTYAAPSEDAKVTGTIRQNGATFINAKLSNGWYRLHYHFTGTFDYVRPEDLMIVGEKDTGNYPEPVYPFPDVNYSAPEPEVTVTPITTKATDELVENIKTISEVLGFQKKISPSGIEEYYYAPDGRIVRNGGHEALEFHYVPDVTPQTGDTMRLLIKGWGKNEYTVGQIEKVPAAVREILKYYYPTGYKSIYDMLSKGFDTGVDMDEFINTMFVFDNRELRIEVYREGSVGIFIGREGMRYTNSFTLPDNVVLVKVNGKRLITEQPAIVENGTTIAPLRGIFEALGAKVEWDPDTQSITATKGDKSIFLTIGNTNATANGNRVTLDAAPKIKDGTTLVPVRFISQSLGAEVEWDETTRTALIHKP